MSRDYLFKKKVLDICDDMFFIYRKKAAKYLFTQIILRHPEVYIYEDLNKLVFCLVCTKTGKNTPAANVVDYICYMTSYDDEEKNADYDEISSELGINKLSRSRILRQLRRNLSRSKSGTKCRHPDNNY